MTTVWLCEQWDDPYLPPTTVVAFDNEEAAKTCVESWISDDARTQAKWEDHLVGDNRNPEGTRHVCHIPNPGFNGRNRLVVGAIREVHVYRTVFAGKRV